MTTRQEIIYWTNKAIAADLGYDQGQRMSFLDKLNKIIRSVAECDCSSLAAGIWWLAGALTDEAIANQPNSATWEYWARKSGATIINVEGLTVSQIAAKMEPGDVILGPGHVVDVLDRKDSNGRYMVLSAEQDENGGKAGGKAGDQTGKEVLVKSLYARSRGWTRLIKPKLSESQVTQIAAVSYPYLTPNTDGGTVTQKLKAWLHGKYDFAANVDSANGYVGTDTWNALQSFARMVGLLEVHQNLSSWGPKCWSAARANGFNA